MDGVMNMKREFSSDFDEMKDWKYEVDYFDDCTQIKYMAFEDGIWKCKESIDITACCDEILFRTIAKDLKGKYWVGTQGNGIFRLSFDSNKKVVLDFPHIIT